MLPPPPEDSQPLEAMLSALHKATASLDVKLARWHESVYLSLEDGDQEPWPDDLPLPSFNPLVTAVNLNSTGSTPAEPAPRASGTRKRRKARAPK